MLTVSDGKLDGSTAHQPPSPALWIRYRPARMDRSHSYSSMKLHSLADADEVRNPTTAQHPSNTRDLKLSPSLSRDVDRHYNCLPPSDSVLSARREVRRRERCRIASGTRCLSSSKGRISREFRFWEDAFHDILLCIDNKVHYIDIHEKHYNIRIIKLGSQAPHYDEHVPKLSCRSNLTHLLTLMLMYKFFCIG